MASGRSHGSMPCLRSWAWRSHQAVGIVDRRGHQHVGFVGGVAEHQALVAGALFVFSLASTPMAMSGDCLPMAFSTAQEAPSKPMSELL